MFNDCWVYTMTYNSEELLPHFFHHHRKADRIVVYDNGSTDRTIAICEGRPNVEIRDYSKQSGNQLRDDIHALIKNSCWKEAIGNADWVVVMDLDEFLYHPRLQEKLKEYKQQGITIPLTTAYEMVSPLFPAAPVYLTDVVKMGRRNDLYSKFTIFDPNKITDINYGPGGHNAVPAGEIKYSGIPHWNTVPVPPYPPLIIQRFFKAGEMEVTPPPNELKILHYRFVGMDRIERMWEGYKKRMSQLNMSQGWGRHYFLPKEEQDRIYSLLAEQAERVVE